MTSWADPGWKETRRPPGSPERAGVSILAADMGELARELRGRIEGDVRFDRATRILYSNDASIYQIEPTGVVIPRHAADVAETLRACSAAGAPVLPRGGGTSLAGQAVGEALVMDLSVHFRSVLEVNREEMWARVQPGVVQDAFGAALAPYGLRFGPETSTSNRANLGGMIGNNSAGARSLVYGKTVDNVLDATVVLPDGRLERLGWMRWDDMRRRVREGGPLARLLREVLALREEYGGEIRARFPRIPRRVSGYNLDVLLDPDGVNLAHLVVGSEGTLATVVEARVRLHRMPPAVGLAVLHFDSLLPALEAGVVALDLGPTAVELVDSMVLRLARESLEYSRRLGFVEGEPGALILVEFAGESRGEVASRLDRLERRLGGRGAPLLRMLDPADQKNVWQVRKAALPLLLSLPGDKKPIAFVEDTAVEPARLPEFIDRFEEILAGRDTEGSFYAHAGAGCLHIRPLINLKDPAEIRKMDALAREVCDLVLDFGGSMSGEHGDGLARSHFNERVFGPRVYEAFRRLKTAFDPAGIMNPGKVVNAPPMSENLRYGERVPRRRAAGGVPLSARKRFRRRGRALQRGRGLPEGIGRDDVPVVHGDPRGGTLHPRAGQPAAGASRRPPRPHPRFRGPGAGGARPLPLVQGVQGRMSLRGGHGAPQVGLPPPLLPEKVAGRSPTSSSARPRSWRAGEVGSGRSAAGSGAGG